MSGLEVLGAASAASALLETAIGIVGRVRNAHERQKDLASMLSRHNKDLTDTKMTIQIIKDEEALRTAAVASELVVIDSVGKKLVDFLRTLEPGDKAPLRQLTHQLVHGSKDEMTLANIIVELTRIKSNLSLRIQVANVGLTRNVDDTIVANTAVVKEGQGLKIIELLKNRSLRGDGMVPLSNIDIASLGDEVTSSTDDPNAAVSSPANASSTTSRIVLDNSTKDQALQINGPIGEKGWWEVSRLEIKNNTAVGRSIQVNHGTSMDVFNRLMADRAADRKS